MTKSISKITINFFYDSKILNRDWYLDPNKSSKSGTELSLSNLIINLSIYFKINLYCTKIPNDNIINKIKIKNLPLVFINILLIKIKIEKTI